MGKSRAERERRSRYKSFYKTFHDGNRCYYCGDQKTTVDHVPALDTVYKMGVDEVEKQGAKLILVNSCRECNAMLSNRVLLTLDNRVKYLYKRLQKRYKRILACDEWSDEELDDLDGSLRSYVALHANMHKFIEGRLKYMEDLFYDVLVDDEY